MLLLSQRAGPARRPSSPDDCVGSVEVTEPYVWSLLPFAGVVDQSGLDSLPFVAVDWWRRGV